MEIKGEEFIKNVQLKQEKDEIKQRLHELEEEERDIEDRTPRFEDEIDLKIQDESELSNLLLSSSKSKMDKKKYIILGLALVVLFLVAIVIFRISSNSETSKDTILDDKPEEIKQDKLIENDSIEQKYQKLINEKIKMINQEKKSNEKIDSELDINKVQELEKKEPLLEKTEPKITPEQQEKQKADIFEMKEESFDLKVEPIVKEEPKPTVKPKETVKPVAAPWPVKKSVVKEPEVKSFAEKAVKPTGIFIQVGAFSKEPAKKFLEKITTLGYSYKLYPVEVKGKIFNKLLIGPYNSRDMAKKDLNSIKTKLDAPNAFIINL